MLATFDALQKIVVNLKTDMLSLFNIAVDYQDADIISSYLNIQFTTLRIGFGFLDLV